MQPGRVDASNLRNNTNDLARNPTDMDDMSALFGDQPAVSKPPRQPRGMVQHHDRNAEDQNMHLMDTSGHRDVSISNSNGDIKGHF